jgi:hypothetical protein
VIKDSDQTQTASRKFKLGPLGNLNQVTKGLAKTIRAAGDAVRAQAQAKELVELGVEPARIWRAARCE